MPDPSLLFPTVSLVALSQLAPSYSSIFGPPSAKCIVQMSPFRTLPSLTHSLTPSLSLSLPPSLSLSLSLPLSLSLSLSLPLSLSLSLSLSFSLSLSLVQVYVQSRVQFARYYSLPLKPSVSNLMAGLTVHVVGYSYTHYTVDHSLPHSFDRCPFTHYGPFDRVRCDRYPACHFTHTHTHFTHPHMRNKWMNLYVLHVLRMDYEGPYTEVCS